MVLRWIKIHVVYPGVDPPLVQDAGGIRAKYGLPDRYFLFIGTLQPRKNIHRIVQAFAQWQSANPQDQTGLVLAGGKGWLYDEAWAKDVAGVVVTGYIDEEDKGVLLSKAVGLVFPTLHEGFGFPVIEAMHCGIPVIASNTSSLPELVGDAGLLVDPLDVNAITDAMQVLVGDRRLREELIMKGKQRAEQFTWQRAAEQTIQILEAIARG